MHSRKTRLGFTLIEVAIAGFLVALLSACVFRGILTVKDHARATADHIAAQGLCMERYESMKSVAWDNVTRDAFPTTNVLLSSLSKDPTRGRLMAEITNNIEGGVQDFIRIKNVDITCRWTFRGRERSETIHGIIVDGYSTYAEAGSLSVSDFKLNPNYALPQMFYVRTVDGEVYTQLNISQMPSSLDATTIVVMPGGGGERQSVSLNGESRSVSNEKTIAFTASALSDPLRVKFGTETVKVETADGEEEVTRYRIRELSCGMASFSYR